MMRSPLLRVMLYGSRETEKSLWKDVLPIVNCAPNTPCIQAVAHSVDWSGSSAWPERSSAPCRRVTIRSLSRSTTWRCVRRIRREEG